MAFLEWLIHETSLHSLLNTGSRDLYIILLLRFLRMFAYGSAALVLGMILWRSGNTGTQIGTFLSLVLLGDAGISYLLTVKADKIGRRRVLGIGSVLMTLAGVVFMLTSNYYLLLIAAILGVISPGAHEIGPFRAESIVAQLTPVEARTDVYAWFAIMSTVGIATGLSTAGWITYILRTYYEYDWKDRHIYAAVFGLYAVIGLIKGCVTLLLSEKCEPDEVTRRDADLVERDATSPLLNSGYRRTERRGATGKATGAVRTVWQTVTVTLSPESRRILLRLCFLFSLNTFASAMLPVAMMSWYVNWRFRWFVLYRVGWVMSGIWLMASFANLFSASVARRIGLVRTMVLTHLPGAIFLAFIPLSPDWKVMLFLLLFSSVFTSMDQAPRTAFIAAAFKPSERTAVMGTINFFRTIASAGGPLVTGYFMEKKMWWATFLVAAALKVSYDIGLLVMFLKTKLPEYENGPRELTITDVDVGILLSENFQRHDFGQEYGHLDVEDMEETDHEDRPRDKASYASAETIEEV